MPIKALLFDLDDTLYDEKQFVESGFKEVARFTSDKFGIDQEYFYQVLVDVYDEGVRGKIFNVTLERLNIKYCEDIISLMVKKYREHNPKIKLDKNTKLLLLRLKEIYSLGIITDGYFEVQQKKIQVLKLQELFDIIIYTDKYGKEHWKPDVFSYKLALEEFQVVPGEAIYIGDNPYKDFIGAKKIGIPTIRILQPGREYTNIRLDKKYEADYEIKELYEIMNILRVFE